MMFQRDLHILLFLLFLPCNLKRAIVVVPQKLCSPRSDWFVNRSCDCMVWIIWGRGGYRLIYHLEDTPDLNNCQTKSLYPLYIQKNLSLFASLLSKFYQPVASKKQNISNYFSNNLLSTSNVFLSLRWILQFFNSGVSKTPEFYSIHLHE